MLLGRLCSLCLVKSAMATVIDEEDKIKLKYFTTAMTVSRSSEKPTYDTWLSFLNEGNGIGSKYVVEAFFTILAPMVRLAEQASKSVEPMCVPLGHFCKRVQFMLVPLGREYSSKCGEVRCGYAHRLVFFANVPFGEVPFTHSKVYNVLL